MRQTYTNTCSVTASIQRKQSKSLFFLHGIDTRQAWASSLQEQSVTFFAIHAKNVMDAPGALGFGARSFQPHHPARSHSLTQPKAPSHPLYVLACAPTSVTVCHIFCRSPHKAPASKRLRQTVSRATFAHCEIAGTVQKAEVGTRGGSPHSDRKDCNHSCYRTAVGTFTAMHYSSNKKDLPENRHVSINPITMKTLHDIYHAQ